MFRQLPPASSYAQHRIRVLEKALALLDKSARYCLCCLSCPCATVALLHAVRAQLLLVSVLQPVRLVGCVENTASLCCCPPPACSNRTSEEQDELQQLLSQLKI